MFQSHKYLERYKINRFLWGFGYPLVQREGWPLENRTLICENLSCSAFSTWTVKRAYRERITVFRAPPAAQWCWGAWRIGTGLSIDEFLGPKVKEPTTFHSWKGSKKWLVQTYTLEMGKLQPKRGQMSRPWSFDWLNLKRESSSWIPFPGPPIKGNGTHNSFFLPF